MKKLQYLWEELNASFWFIPVLMLVIASGFAFFFLYLDTSFDYQPSGFWKYLFSGSVDSARSILTIIAGAMIGVAGTVFSITLVVLTLASSQLGMRLIRNFMYDKLTQVALGIYVASFVYCLLIINAIRENDELIFVPVISVFVALVLAFAGIVFLVIFIHHVSVSIQADKVISDISDTMSKSIQKLFPEDIGQEDDLPDPSLEDLKRDYPLVEKVKSPDSGYLQSVDGDTLLEIATENNSVVILHHRPGDFLVKNAVMCEYISKEPNSEDLIEKINDCFIVGKVRTPLQDAEFSIHQMVEVASRALSPGINDPYTAIACIDNLTSVLCYLAGARFPSSYRFDEQGSLRIIADKHSFKGMLDAAFNQIRQYADKSPAVMIRLLESMVTIHSFAQTEAQKKEISAHGKMIVNAAERSFHETRDLKDLKKRYKMLKGEK